MPRGGARPGSGRPKGQKNTKTQEGLEWISLNKPELLDKAMEMVREGNHTVLAKLLDKVLPTLTENKNETEITFNIKMDY